MKVLIKIMCIISVSMTLMGCSEYENTSAIEIDMQIFKTVADELVSTIQSEIPLEKIENQPIRENKNEKELSEESIDYIQLSSQIDEYICVQVPELEQYAEYISRESEGAAYLTIEPMLTAKELSESGEVLGEFYAVYVGEAWENHSVNWDWFWVRNDFNEILWENMYGDGKCYMTLEEWRTSEYYREWLRDESIEQVERYGQEKNHPYELFYGEWEITDVIYVDPMVVNGTYLSEEEISFFKEEKYAGQDERKIRFAENELVINEVEVWSNIDYRVIIIPNDEDYELYHTMTLGDLGLTKDKADYYSYVEVLYGNSKEQALHFFMKDENTIILYWLGSYAIEYKRISYDGGSEKPIIILG